MTRPFARRCRLAGACLAIGVATPARSALAQHESTVAGAMTELDSATSSALLHDLDRASSRGLPMEPLLAKVREGRLKRAPGPRIRLAVAALATRLDSAQKALGASATIEELSAGADALAAGADIEALRAVRLASPPRSRGGSLSAPLGALAQLVASGVPTRRATAMIVELLKRNASASQVVAFGNAVESDAAGGLPGEEAATFRLRAASTATAEGDATSPAASSTGSSHLSPPPAGSSTPRRRP